MNHLAISGLAERPYWVFDLDGTLTVPVHDFNAIRSELGIPVGDDILGYLASIPEEQSIKLHGRLQEIELGLAGVTTASEGALELLDRLYSSGARLGVLTRNTRENALRTLEMIGLGGHFHPDAVVGRENALPKPDPDGILRLAAAWGASSIEVVMVGDYLFDLQAGRAAGAMTVHVDPHYNFRWPELTDLAVGSLAELAGYIQI
jgi:phosphoglycolate phosphatase-like HAD superfamily hydrolase